MRARQPLVVPADQEEEHRLLEELSRDLGRASDPAAFQGLAGPRFQELCGCASAVFCVPEGQAGPFVPAVVSGALKIPEPQPQFAPRGTLAKWLRVNEETLVLAERPAVVEYLTADEQAHLRVLQAVACTPLISEGRLLSFVILSDDEPWRPGITVKRLIDLCARQAALVSETVARHHRERLRLEAAARAQQLAVTGQLAAAVAHEVRNPLTTIRSSVQFVIDSKAEWTSKSDLLRHVITEVDRINGTVMGVLRLSRPQALSLSDLDLEQVAHDALALFQPHFDHHRLTLTRERAAGAIPIRGDHGQLRQVLLNIILNACQATPDRGEITVVSRAADGVAEVAVRDTGCGMTREQLARAFEPFFTTKANGTGLGLATCQDIVTRHGSSMRIESEPGAGTTVFVVLPLRAS